MGHCLHCVGPIGDGGPENLLIFNISSMVHSDALHVDAQEPHIKQANQGNQAHHDTWQNFLSHFRPVLNLSTEWLVN